ncbi:MAG: hypothetical protein FD129_2420 [bacterium]|nr:MAG: hypothetical protein FD129_2420 [bacterium]
MTTVAVDHFKKALDAVDERIFLDWVTGEMPLDPALRAGIVEFVRGERSRLIKLKSLGLTHRSDERIRLVDRILEELAGA